MNQELVAELDKLSLLILISLNINNLKSLEAESWCFRCRREGGPEPTNAQVLFLKA